MLRRTLSRPPEDPEPFDADGVRIDLARRTVGVDGVQVALTRKEFEVLALLVRACGTAVSRDRIVAEVWRTTYQGMSRTLDVHMATLRAKLGRGSALVQTVRGFGYRLTTGGGGSVGGGAPGPRGEGPVGGDGPGPGGGDAGG